METNAEVVSRARRRLVGAKRLQKQSWEELFSAFDKDRSHALDLKELKTVVREGLLIPQHSLCDHDLAVLFAEIDGNGGGSIDLTEFLTFVARGPKPENHDEMMFAKRTGRVQRNLRVGFQKYSSNDNAIAQLFDHMDKEDDGKISLHELTSFIRKDLKLSQWDIFNSDLKTFYKSLDEDGDGIDIQEFVNFIQHNNRKKGKQFAATDGFGFGKPVRKHSTYRSQLLRQLSPAHSTSSLPDATSRPGSSTSSMSSSASTISMASSPSFVNLGRTRPPIVR
mmetsp:Transcript_106864/g.189916  ORF Transcript_106864/g.189916 Transcript_106864/m.189916 type:complete len:280 (+) Transcript_106864:96-935(+)